MTNGRRIAADEIPAKQFPRRRRGLDPRAVQEWLVRVAESQRDLEAELEALRTRERRLDGVVERARSRPATSAVRVAILDARLGRRLFGYSRARVERLLAAAVAEIARLETQTTILQAECDALRARAGERSGARVIDLAARAATREG